MSFARNLSDKYEKILLENVRKTGLDAAESEATGEATVEFLGNKIVEKIVKHDANSRNVKEINIQLEKRQEILNELRHLLQNGAL